MICEVRTNLRCAEFQVYFEACEYGTFCQLPLNFWSYLLKERGLFCDPQVKWATRSEAEGHRLSRERFNNSLRSQSLSHWSSLPVRPGLIYTDFLFFVCSDPNNILLGQNCGLHQSSSSDFCSWKSLVRISIDFPKAKYCCSCLYIHPEVSSGLKQVSSQLFLTYRPSLPKDIL